MINTLLKNPSLIDQVPKLYEVKVILIPKGENKVRPIQITETILRLFHKVLLNVVRRSDEENHDAASG